MPFENHTPFDAMTDYLYDLHYKYVKGTTKKHFKELIQPLFNLGFPYFTHQKSIFLKKWSNESRNIDIDLCAAL